MPLSACLSPAQLTAPPGTSVAFTLEVRAGAADAQDVRLQVGGTVEEWAVVVPPRLLVPAGGTARARVVVAVPRSHRVVPGARSVKIAVLGAQGQVEDEAHAVVEVEAFADLRASVSPRVSRGRQGGLHTLHVENSGNEALAATLDPAAADPGVVVEMDRAEVTLAPGEAAAVPVRLRSRGRRLLGRPRARAFAVALRPASGAAGTTVEGLFVQERVRWPAPVAAGLAAAAVAWVLLGGRDHRPSSPPAVAPAAPATAAVAGTGAPQAACPPEPADAAAGLLVQNFLFCPVTVTVARGSELRWVNRDQAPHTATADGPDFDTGAFGQGEARTVRFDRAGTYTYFCRLHPFMRGTVVVTG